LWKFDGTATGTTRVAESTEFTSLASLTNANGRLCFTDGGSELWTSDGTQDGTKSAWSGSGNLANLTLLNTGALYFTKRQLANNCSRPGFRGWGAERAEISGVDSTVDGDVVSLVGWSARSTSPPKTASKYGGLDNERRRNICARRRDTETAVRVADSLFDIQSLADLSGRHGAI
jgi:ELWxxDGT repeat protein